MYVCLYAMLIYSKYTVSDLYQITTSDYAVLNSIWLYTQYSGLDIPMYRTRLYKGYIEWVVVLPNSSVRTWFLLQYSQYVVSVRSGAST